ncbi:DUF1489 family protein [Sphingomonas sp. AAP5]|uniref:DUF1489 family protein n=1 Tax=Sphingomonas glacialis TaxID=658225 RepID=A0ABQ3LKV7_9SPHN|nr:MULTISPECIES: DUF1489 domain-containing protein [Sphingomonas]MDY7523969.1 DUF1489 domain-containing protein [Sphingomonas sp. 10B4]MEB0282515.1 DUF1489 domain-containing protein [Sphingomonas sp. 10B4]QBM76893.1 DUF1489 family protein [Sphingomonas sp. AAP5]GHH19209.1 hypothetical protein GCM10008023_25980 [Sphingomonas glacialis]
MPLHLTKVAFGATSLDHLDERLRQRGAEGPVFLTTRYLPKRHEEIVGTPGGSLYWIIKHTLVARSPILGFGEAEGGRVAIHIDPALVLTEGRPKRAHQGWRYLEPGDAPADLGAGMVAGDVMPTALLAKLSALGLV